MQSETKENISAKSKYMKRSNGKEEVKKVKAKEINSNNFVEENLRLKFRNVLSAFRENSEQEEFSFPSSLTNIERKYIHKLVSELGLVSKSTGSGENRSITVRKITSAAAKKPLHMMNAIPIHLINPKESFFFQKYYSESHLTHVNEELKNRIRANKEKESNKFNEILKNNQIRNNFYNVNNTKYLKFLEENYIKNIKSLESNQGYINNLEKRGTLPAAFYRESICELINNNQIILISGETGCGKSTQVPQFILEDYNLGKSAKILMTQPRRLNVLSLTERISFERNDFNEQTIGYHIRLDKKYNKKSNKLLIVTTGILLNKFMFDKELNEYNIIIIDEAHEKDYYSEFLFILLKELCNKRKNLKVILMSATFNTEKLRNYFNNIPHINIGCSLFPVSEYYLEHVLKFIQYDKKLKGGNEKAINKNFKSFSSAYTCTLCGLDNFLSPQELGIHSAFCFPSSKNSTLTSNNSDKNLSINSFSNKKNNFIHLENQLSLLKLQLNNDKSINKVLNLMKSSEKSIVTPIESLISETEMDEKEMNYSNEQDLDIVSDELSDIELESSLFNLPTEYQEQKQERLNYNLEDPQYNFLLESYQKDHTNEELSVDYNLIVSLLEYIFSSEFIKDHSSTSSNSSVRSGGSILIFLPGWDDIIQLHQHLLSHDEFNNNNINIYQLHSNIPKNDQELIFLPLRKNEIRIILSTNIAETSLTINNITIIINTCIVKEKYYDPYLKLNYLRTNYCSKSSLKQRKGRAGRLEPGVCFHLISQNCFNSLKEEQLSEILRIPLEEIILQVKALGVTDDEEKYEQEKSNIMNINSNSKKTIKNFLLQAIDPPHELSITNGINLLNKLNFLTTNNKLTTLGESLCFFSSLNPRYSKVFILASLLGYYNEALYLITILNSRSPFILINNKNPDELKRFNEVKKKFSFSGNSDFLILINILKTFENKFYNKNQKGNEKEKVSFCNENFLSINTMKFLIDTKKQYERQYEELFYYLKDTDNDENDDETIEQDNTKNNLVSLLSTFSQRKISNKFIFNYFKDTNEYNLKKKIDKLHENLILTIISSSLYPNISLRYLKKKNFFTEKNLKLNIHGSSINKKFNTKGFFFYNENGKEDENSKLEILSFHDLIGLNVQREGVFIDSAAYSMLGTSICPLISLLIFAGDVKVISEEEIDNIKTVIISIDEWISLKLSFQDYQIIKNLREFVDNALLLYLQKDLSKLKETNVVQTLDCLIATLDFYTNNPL